MGKIANNKYRAARADVLRRFGKVLYELGAIKDKKPFEDAANECANGPVPNTHLKTIDRANCWGYNLNNVLFNMQPKTKIKELKPSGSVLSSIQMNVLVIGNCIVNENHIEDPLAHLEFNIIIKGELTKKSSVVCSWHLDRHPEGLKDPEDVHPVYHIQYGGKNLNLGGETFHYGSNLILDTPRFAHLPLDGILGADFILSNFFGEFRKNCCDNSTAYSRYLRDSQDTFWRPYVLATSHHWNKSSPIGYGWPAVKIFPQLISEVK